MKKIVIGLIVSILIIIAGFFAVISYYGYLEYITKYVEVVKENCSNAKKLDEKTLEDLPTLKRALEIAENKGRALPRVSVDEFNRIRSKIGGGICVEYNGKCYRIWLITT